VELLTRILFGLILEGISYGLNGLEGFLGEWTIKAASSTGRCNTISVDPTTLPMENRSVWPKSASNCVQNLRF